MIIFVYGDSPHLLKRKVEELQKGFVQKFDPSKFNFDEFVYSEKAEKDIVQVLNTPPFLGEKRMLVIRGLLTESNAKPFAALWIDRFHKKTETTLLVLVEEIDTEKVEKHKIWQGLRGLDNVHMYPLGNLSGVKLEQWVMVRAKDLGIMLRPQQSRDLIQRASGDMETILLELAKLQAFTGQDTISDTNFNLLISKNVEDNIFQLIDAVQAGNINKALSLLQSQRDYGTSDMQILAMLIRQMRLLKKMKVYLEENGQSSAKDLGMHPFVAKKVAKAVQGTNLDEINDGIDLLIDLEMRVKTGKIRDIIAVDRTVLKIMRA